MNNLDDDRRLGGALQTALESVKSNLAQVGFVDVVLNCGVWLDASEISKLLEQFEQCVGEQTPDPYSLRSPQGFQVAVSEEYPLVKKYLKSMTLHGETQTGAWVQASFPADWEITTARAL